MFYVKTMTSNEGTLNKRAHSFQKKTFRSRRFFYCKTLSILKRKEDGISAERQCGMTKSGIKQLVRLFDHKCGINQREVAR